MDGVTSDGSQEPNFRVDDPNLSRRARELIRIGEIDIARENQAALAGFFHPDCTPRDQRSLPRAEGRRIDTHTLFDRWKSILGSTVRLVLADE